MSATLIRAVALIESIDRSLAAGVQHFDKNDKPLFTVKEILEALKRDGEIRFKSPSQECPG